MYFALAHTTQEGDPICDAFHVKLFSNRALFALADGCAWGFRPREAARRATKAFIHYLEQHQQQIHDVKEAGHFLLRAFDKASREIVVGKDDIWEAGTTTLLGAILLQLELPLEQQLQGVIKTCLVCANVGDCKVQARHNACCTLVRVSSLSQRFPSISFCCRSRLSFGLARLDNLLTSQKAIELT